VGEKGELHSGVQGEGTTPGKKQKNKRNRKTKERKNKNRANDE